MSSINYSNSKFIRLTVITALAGVAVSIGMWSSKHLTTQGIQPDYPPEPGAVTKPRALSDFNLTDQNGRPFGLQNLKGKWTFMFFGYTRCPDVCPTTMAALQRIAKVLERDPRQINPQFVFVSVDPQRDNLEGLGGYVEFFNPRFVGITGKPEQLHVLEKQLDVETKRIKEEGPMNYLLSHTSSIMLIDPQARLLAKYPPPHERATIIEKFFMTHHKYQNGEIGP